MNYRQQVLCLRLMVVLAALVSSALATTGELGIVRDFAISPYGRSVAFVSEQSDGEGRSNADLMLVGHVTGEVIGLTSRVIEAAISPDGAFLASIIVDNHRGHSLLLFDADGRRLRWRTHRRLQSFSHLRWSEDSQYLACSVWHWGDRGDVIYSPWLGVMPGDLETLTWVEPSPLPPDHPLAQKRPVIPTDSQVVWRDDTTLYTRATDGIWLGQVHEPFFVRWQRVVEAEGIQAFAFSPTGDHLLYTRTSDTIWAHEVHTLSTNEDAEPVKLGLGSHPQFTADGKWVFFSYLGLWQVSVDGSERHRLTHQTSTP